MTALRRVLILGGPRVGKTTLAIRLGEEHGLPVRHTDDIIGLFKWGDDSEHVAGWLCEPGPFIVEGVTVVRALRKWLVDHPEGAPADIIYLSDVPKVDLTPKQRATLRGCMSVWSDVALDLARRGIHIHSF